MANGFDDDTNIQPRTTGSAPRSGGNKLLLFLGIGGGVLLLCCGGCFAMGYLGLGAVGEMVKQQYGNDPAVVAEIGPIQDASTNLIATGEQQQQRGDGFLAFDVTGANGSGLLVVKQFPNGEFGDGVLIANGKEIALDGGAGVEVGDGADVEIDLDNDADDAVEGGTVDEDAVEVDAVE